MPKIFTSEELAEFKTEGAEITLEKREVEIGNLECLVDQFKRMADASEQVAKKNNSDMVQAIDNLAKAVTDKELKTEQLGPVLQQLIELQKLAIKSNERPEYVFDIKRNQRQFMTQVIAKPVDKNVH